MPRSRGWCFTINNYTLDDEELVKALVSTSDFQYVVCGKEIGESGTPHLQGYCYWEQPKSHTQLKRWLPRSHYSAARGSAQDNQAYCSKEQLWFEEGTLPVGPKGQKDKWKEVITLAKAGDLQKIEDEYPAIFLRYYYRLRTLRTINCSELQGPLEHEWWVGPPGTGKSWTLNHQYPDHYRKMMNKWWDGYEGEPVVAIEEWEPDCPLAHHLKQWADRYPFNAEVKGGVLKNIRPRKIIVLSNFDIERCFQVVEFQNAIRRRFKVKRFICSGLVPIDD